MAEIVAHIKKCYVSAACLEQTQTSYSAVKPDSDLQCTKFVEWKESCCYRYSLCGGLCGMSLSQAVGNCHRMLCDMPSSEMCMRGLKGRGGNQQRCHLLITALNYVVMLVLCGCVYLALAMLCTYSYVPVFVYTCTSSCHLFMMTLESVRLFICDHECLVWNFSVIMKYCAMFGL